MAKQLESVAALACMTVLLMLFNFVFLCTGLVMLGGGIYMKLQLQNYADLGMENSDAALLATACLGALVALVGLLACCCIVRQHPSLLYVYGGFLAVIALLELAAGAAVYTYRDALTKSFDKGLNESMLVYGKVDVHGHKDPKTRHIDLMQANLQCCGNRDYKDWQKLSPPKYVPESCCKVAYGECQHQSQIELDDIYTQGCYNRVVDFVKGNVGLVAGSALGVAVFPMLGVVLACCLASYINKVNYEQMA
ncbi:tetraspanin-7-like [Phymastichus coffea]|uniref:tetraspanin-7-like n=1 Tax=Phymastichus coffea TaxID=108790 RepID=UPI00273B52B9|nr:tetraspanin-7-like [Phymastichus coffea]